MTESRSVSETMPLVPSIPGPRELPWLGSLPQMLKDSAAFFVALERKYGEVAAFSLFGNKMLLVSNPDMIRRILVEDVEHFPKAAYDLAILSPYLGKGLLTNPSHENHRQQRKLAQPAFHHKRIQGYAEIMVEESANMLSTWEDGATRDISEEMMRLTLMIVARSLFNEDAARMAQLAGTIGHAVNELQEVVDEDFTSPFSFPKWMPTPGNRRRQTLRTNLRRVIDTLIANRMADSAGGRIQDRGDLLSMLLLAEDEETGKGMTHEQLRDELITILVAGHETTSNALTWAWYLLSQHPDAADKLHAEVDEVLEGRAPQMEDMRRLPYTTQVIKEALRLYPPAWTLNAREAAHDTTLGSYAIARGTNIFIAPYSIHRQARYFADPDAFRPERWTSEFEAGLPRFAYMPFGGGPRICIGNSFAMMEAVLILAGVSARYELTLVPGTKVVGNAQITLSVKGGLPMRLVARKAAHNAVEPEMSTPMSSQLDAIGILE